MTKKEILNILQEVSDEWGRIINEFKYDYSEFEWKMFSWISDQLIIHFDNALESIREDLEEEQEEEE